MKVSNIDIIDTVADEKKINWCLIQGWCFKKSLCTVPKTERLTLSCTVNFVFVYFSGRNLCQSTFQSGSRNSSDFQIQTVQTDFLFLKKLFILKVLNVLGLKNSIELKETMQYYTNLPIFEHFGCYGHWKFFPILTH